MGADEFKKTQVNLKVTLELDNQLTWGELYQFVELARNAGEHPDEPVLLETDPMNTEPVITGMAIYIKPDDLPQSADAIEVTVRDAYNPVD